MVEIMSELSRQQKLASAKKKVCLSFLILKFLYCLTAQLSENG